MSARSNNNREPTLYSDRTALDAQFLGETFISALEDVGFDVPDYDVDDFTAGATGIAYAIDREYDDNFERPDVTPELTFRYQGTETPNSLDQYPVREEVRNELLDHVVAGDVRIPVSDPVPADVASAKTGVAEELTSVEPYVEPGERSVDLQFTVAGANPPGTISTAMNNTREVIEALAYIQDQRLPPGMAVNAFDGRIQSNPSPDVIQPEGTEIYVDSPGSDIITEAVDPDGEYDVNPSVQELLEQGERRTEKKRETNTILDGFEYEELSFEEQEIELDQQL